MNHPFFPLLRCAARAGLAALIALIALPAVGAPAHATEAGPARQMSPVEIKRKTNPGDLSYKTFFDIQTFIQSLLPPEPRVIDLGLRVLFTELSGAARDEYNPDSWAVAIVGETVDHTVPVSRGGYFLLPELKQAAAERATIMFNTQTRKRTVDTVWTMRIGATQTLAYANFAKALDEVRFLQKQIPWYRLGLRQLRLGAYDGLRACFLGEGRIEVDGQAADTVIEGGCQVLRFDPALAAGGRADIRFVGPLHIVTLHEVSL